MKIRANIGNVYVMPTMESLLIMPKSSNPDIISEIQDIGKEIFGILPHTPITAIGHNFGYKLDNDEVLRGDVACLSEPLKDHLPKNLSTQLIDEYIFSWKRTLDFERKNYKLNITYANDANRVRTLQFNFHHDIDADGDKNKQIKNILSSYVDNYKIAVEMKKSMIVNGE